MRFLLGLLVLVLPLAIAAAPVPTHIMPKDDPVCYPLRVGDRSVFQAGEHEIVYTVTKVEKVESGTRVTNEVFYGEQKITRISIVIVSPRGVQHVEAPGQKLDQPIWWLKLPHESKWTGTWPMGWKYEFETKGWEAIEVPAGKYRAIRVDRKDIWNDADQGTTTYWYAPGLGCIKIAGRSPARVLKSFTPGKG